MAKADGITVEINELVHSACAEMAQSISDAYGVQIQSVEFDWLDASTAEKQNELVASTTAKTKAKNREVSR